jgi:hypothetical protein
MCGALQPGQQTLEFENAVRREGWREAVPNAAAYIKLKVLISKCPFRNLPESRKGRWGEGLTAEDMKRCRWLRPQLVAVARR